MTLGFSQANWFNFIVPYTQRTVSSDLDNIQGIGTLPLVIILLVNNKSLLGLISKSV